ncbi:hypothetical protein ACTGWA_10950, partial [Streptococcus suis]
MQRVDLTLPFPKIKIATRNIGICARTNALQVFIELSPSIEHAQPCCWHDIRRLIKWRSADTRYD